MQIDIIHHFTFAFSKSLIESESEISYCHESSACSCKTVFAVLSSRLLINGCRDSLPLYTATFTFQTTSITLHYIKNHIPHAPEQIPVSKILKGALPRLEQVIFSGKGPWPQAYPSCHTLMLKVANETSRNTSCQNPLDLSSV